MDKFLKKHIFQPLAGRWLLGVLLLLFWTISFLFLPALSGWFLAASSVAFITANTMFAYLIPSSIIRLMTILRTASRYFERLQNHKSTLDAQRRLQLRIFESVARFPYFKKQVNNNSSILENSTHGIDLILNHILLWILPLATLVISILLYGIFLIIFSKVVAIEFLFSSAVLLFLVPQYILGRNRMHYQQLKNLREENNQALIQSFRGRIEIAKYHLEDKAIHQHTERMLAIERLERKLQTNSFTLQLLVGLGFSLLALFLLWSSAREQMDASLAIGIFFGILAQAELAEMLFAGKSEKSSVTHQINDLDHIITEGEKSVESKPVDSSFGQLQLVQFCARVPESLVKTEESTGLLSTDFSPSVMMWSRSFI